MMDAVCIVGLFGCLFLYLLGRVLYPDEQAGFRPIIPEPNNMLAEEE